MVFHLCHLHFFQGVVPVKFLHLGARPAYLWFFIYVIYTLGVRPAHLCIFPFQGVVPVEFLHLGARPAHL